jgi:hypothetical protein
MHWHARILAFVAVASLALSAASAQNPVHPKVGAQRDTTAAVDSTAADSTDDEADEPRHAVTTGLSYGGVNYEGGRSERATSASLRWRALPWLSIGMNPTFARSSEPNAVITRPATTRSGVTDIPMEINADRTFDVPLSPSVSLGMSVTLPVGDTASGFGSGGVGSSVNLGGGLALTDKLGVHGSVGRSLTDFSIQSTFNGTSSDFGDAGLAFQASDHLSMSVGLDGDIGAIDPTYGRAASVSGGVSVGLPLVNSLSLNASRGISGATPTWSFAIGVGTDFASIGSVSMRGAASRLRHAFGGGTHGLAPKGSSTVVTGRRKHG